MFDKEKILNLIIGQFGALVLACVALYYISQQYVAQIDGIIARCDEDRVIYHAQMQKISEKLDAIHVEIKADCK